MPKLYEHGEGRKTGPPHINSPLTPPTPLNPGVSVDGIQARVFIPHQKLIVGRGAYKNLYSAPFRWVDQPNGKVGIRSLGFSSVLMRFNPAQVEFGQNLWRAPDELWQSVASTFRTILPRVPELSPDRRAWTFLRAGHVDVSGLHLAADFVFDKSDGISHLFRSLRRGWKWSRGRVIDDRYAAATYFRQKKWSLVAYDKERQIDYAFPAMLDWMRKQSARRLRIEVRLGREELRTLGARLHRAHPEIPVLDLGTASEWKSSLYGPVFDLYAARIRPRSGPHMGEPIPLYGLLAHLGATPVWKREVEDYDPDPEFL